MQYGVLGEPDPIDLELIGVLHYHFGKPQPSPECDSSDSYWPLQPPSEIESSALIPSFTMIERLML